MNNFANKARKVADMIEDLAGMVIGEENVKEYFTEAYHYLDGDDATSVVLRYIEENYFS